nr:hypothetical protein [Tanacetum cinerariifolium]
PDADVPGGCRSVIRLRAVAGQSTARPFAAYPVRRLRDGHGDQHHALHRDGCPADAAGHRL